MADTYKALQTVTVTSPSGAIGISFSNIPQSYTDLVIRISARSTNNSPTGLGFYFQPYGSVYYDNYFQGNGSAVSYYSYQGNFGVAYPGTLSGPNDTANAFGTYEIYIPNYCDTNQPKTFRGNGASENIGTTAYITAGATWYPIAQAITGIDIFSNVGNLAQNTTATLYGVFNVDTNARPVAPTIGTASVSDSAGVVNVAFTELSNAASYTVTSSPGGITATGVSSPIRVPVGGSGGLTAGTSYTFTITATNPFGTSGPSAASNSVTARNSTIVVADNGTAAAYSRDAGASWTTFTLPASTAIGLWGPNILFGYGNERFVYMPYTTSNAFYSSNGFTWTSSALGISNFKPSTILYTPSMGFVAQSYLDGSNRVMSSRDGITWSTAPAQAVNAVLGSGYVAAVRTWYYSTHNDPVGQYLTTWAGTAVTNNSFSGSPFFGSFGVAASNGITALHISNFNLTTNLWTTTTGQSLTLGTLPSNGYIGSQCYGSEVGLFIASGSGTVAMTSTNGTSWTNRTKPNIGNTNIVYSRDTGFVAIPIGASATAVATTFDGVTWTTRTQTTVSNQNFVIGQITNYPQKTTV